MWEDFAFNEPYKGEDITEINGIVLPESYIDFMKEHNGGEGDIGETWLVLYPMEELQEINDEFEISELLPGHIIIGSNGGGELYGIDAAGNFINVSAVMAEEDVTVLCNDMGVLAEKINEFWGNL